ncbi:MAG: acylphosphatase [Candidatus Marinimicrobia bacterium]|nr:acylphosphatase [Candidatus Neomarinimicrobiota bacterium]
MEDSTVKITVAGQVQMVGYRWFAKQHADLLGIAGYVRNTSRGEVEIIAQGPEDAIRVFMDYLRAGPSRARIDRIVREPFEGECNFQQFSIKM